MTVSVAEALPSGAAASRERPVYYRVMEAAKLALDEAGIEIPYHHLHLQLFIEDVREPVWARASRLAGAG